MKAEENGQEKVFSTLFLSLSGIARCNNCRDETGLITRASLAAVKIDSEKKSGCHYGMPMRDFHYERDNQDSWPC